MSNRVRKKSLEEIKQLKYVRRSNLYITDNNQHYDQKATLTFQKGKQKKQSDETAHFLG